jgi:ligand-binding sensor domain-containing protein
MTTVNITVDNDADFYRVFSYQTISGVPIDITGANMWMMLRRHAKDEAAVMRLGTDTGEIVLVDPVNGLFSVRIMQSKLVRLGLGDFDQSMIASIAEFKRNIWSGTFTNNPGPSR